MERFDFINKLAKNAGVSTKESRLFAEIFIRKIYSLIQPGDGIKIDGIGTAHYARYKFNSESSVNQDSFTEVLVFIDVEQNSSSTIFTIPQTEELKLNPLDKFYNLSFGKPVISSTGASQKFLSPYDDEVESLLNSKAEKLIESHVVVKNFVDPGLIINSVEPNVPQVKDDTEDAFLDEDLDSLLLSDIKDEELLKELESIKWDLDDETIIDKAEDLQLPEIPGTNFLSEPVNEQTVPDVTEVMSEPEIIESKSDESTLIEQSEEPAAQADEILPDEKFETQNIDSTDIASEFEQVKSFRSGFTDSGYDEESDVDPFQAAIDKVTRDLENDNELDDDIRGQNNYPGINNDFVEVKPKSSMIDSNIMTVINPGEENDGDELEVSEEKKIDPEKYHRDAIKEAANYVNKKRNIGAEKEKKRSRVSLLIIILVLLLLTASIFIYLKFIKSPEPDFRGGTGGGNLDKTLLVEVVERNYELPVSYPYPNSQRNRFVHYDGLDNSLFITGDIKTLIDSASGEISQLEKNSSTTDIINDVSKPVVTRIKENIYKYGNTFVVQVASFKSKTIAENEGLKHNRAGRQSYIEEVEIPGRGTWFRLRIGNFSTIEDAEVFSNKSK